MLLAPLSAPAKLPSWPSVGGAADTLPVLGAALGPVSSWVVATALMLLAVAVVQAVTAGWQRRLAAGASLLIGLGLVAAGSDSVETIPLWLADGAITGLVLLAAWVLVLRHQPALVPLMTAAGAVLSAIHDTVVNAFPGAAAGSLIGAVLVVAAGRLVVSEAGSERRLRNRNSGCTGRNGGGLDASPVESDVDSRGPAVSHQPDHGSDRSALEAVPGFSEVGKLGHVQAFRAVHGTSQLPKAWHRKGAFNAVFDIEN